MSDQVTVNGIVMPLALLTDDHLWWSEGFQWCLSVEKDVLGFVTNGPYTRIKSLVETRDGCCITVAPTRLVKNDVMFMPSFEELHKLWCQKLRQFVDSLGRPRRLFVFVNPFGGKKSATKIFTNQVKRLLEDAQIQIIVQGAHQLHAKEVASSLDITKYEGIVCVSGDGILVETLFAHDSDHAIHSDILYDIHWRYYSISGLVADIDIESKKYRWMGSACLDFCALCRFFNLRQYVGCISFMPASRYEAFGDPTSYPGKSTSKGSNSDPSEVENVNLQKLCYLGPEINLENLN
ncbi:Sphingosine kinase 1 [Spatholobus suberectus]|nr:Sphingosine kinase 1 [Spatholobus suberectus]